MLWRVRFEADFGPKFSKNFAAAKFCVRNRARSRRNPCRLVVRSLLTTCRGPQHLLRASVCCAACDLERISDRNFRKFSRPQNFAFEIARDRAEMHAAWWCAASLRPLEVPNICCERQHAVPRGIACDSEPISDRNFRKIFATAKFCVRNRVRSRINPYRLVVRSLLTTLRGPQLRCRASASCGT